MSLTERISEELKAAMKAKDTLKLSVIRMLKSAVKNEEIAMKKELDETEIIGIVKREIKKRKDSIEAFRSGAREDLATKEEAELKILEEYLPTQAGEEEIRKAVREIIASFPDGEKLHMGKVMPKAVAAFKGGADGKLISQIVKEELGI